MAQAVESVSDRAVVEAILEALESGALESAACAGAVLHGRAVGAPSVYVLDQMIEVLDSGYVLPVW